MIKNVDRPPIIENDMPILPVKKWMTLTKKQKIGYPGKCGWSFVMS